MGRGGLQSEVLDDATARALFVDVDPQRAPGDAAGRMFRMSFDARRYDPADVAVRCDQDGCLVVDARHEELDPATGAKVARQFQRRIQLPPDVDPAKLTSTLSTDGILTVEAPVPPRYQAIVGPPPPADVRAPSVNARASPVSVRLEPAATNRSRSPLLDAAGRPFAGRPTSGNGGGYVPLPLSGGAVRSSPVPFGSLAPVTAFAPAASVPPAPPQLGGVDVPVVTTDPATGRRRLELAMELGRPYTAEDVVVRVDGRRLTVEARHEARDQHGRVTSSSTQKQFDVDELLDESTVRATLTDDGRMIITGYIKQ